MVSRSGLAVHSATAACGSSEGKSGSKATTVPAFKLGFHAARLAKQPGQPIHEVPVDFMEGLQGQFKPVRDHSTCTAIDRDIDERLDIRCAGLVA